MVSMFAWIVFADMADNCIFLLGGVTLGQSGWSISEHIGMRVFGKVVSYGHLGNSWKINITIKWLLYKTLKKIDSGVLSGPRVGLASVLFQHYFLFSPFPYFSFRDWILATPTQTHFESRRFQASYYLYLCFQFWYIIQSLHIRLFNSFISFLFVVLYMFCALRSNKRVNKNKLIKYDLISFFQNHACTEYSIKKICGESEVRGWNEFMHRIQQVLTTLELIPNCRVLAHTSKTIELQFNSIVAILLDATSTSNESCSAELNFFLSADTIYNCVGILYWGCNNRSTNWMPQFNSPSWHHL